MKPTTLLLTLVLACAGQSTPEDAETPDESSSTGAPPKPAEACDPDDLDPCTEGEDIAACAKTAIKYEYEMLEARHQNDGPAFVCHRDTLASVLDHACGLGDAEACTRAPKIRKAAPPS